MVHEINYKSLEHDIALGPTLLIEKDNQSGSSQNIFMVANILLPKIRILSGFIILRIQQLSTDP